MQSSRSFQDVIADAVRRALAEDIGSGDATTIATVPEAKHAKAEILCKEKGVLAGLDVVEETFAQTDNSLEFKPLIEDGTSISPGEVVARVSGSARGILTGERTALNFLQRLSGIATLTAKFVTAVQGTKAKILDTRKTTPGLRSLEKYAVRCGGGFNHRMGLYDMVMIKDNHIVAAGSIADAVQSARQSYPDLPLEVECQSLEQVSQVIRTGGVDRIMLDNMSVGQMREAVSLVAGKIELEASGGVNLDTVRDIALTGVDFISVGALTHSANALDISLDFV